MSTREGQHLAAYSIQTLVARAVMTACTVDARNETAKNARAPRLSRMGPLKRLPASEKPPYKDCQSAGACQRRVRVPHIPSEQPAVCTHHHEPILYRLPSKLHEVMLVTYPCADRRLFAIDITCSTCLKR